MNPLVVAFDLSLTSTGIAVVEADGTAKVRRHMPKTKGYQRIRGIRDACLIAVGQLPAVADVLAVEGPAFGAQGDAYHQLAGLWWHVTEALDSTGIPLVVVPPASIKTYATGKGNATKDLVLAAAVRRFPEVDVNDNNEADALWAAALVRRQYGDPIDAVPAVNLRALDKVAWPVVTLPTRPDPSLL